MELTLVKNTVPCYDRTFEWSAAREVTCETVVPDTMPDIERVLAVESTVLIRSKEADESSVNVSGGVAVCVLYAPEGGGELQSLRAALPVSYELDAPGVTRESIPVAELTAASAEARMLNPRKLLIRVSVQARIECYDTSGVCVTSGVAGEDGARCQTLTEQAVLSPVAAVAEKTFVVSDEYRPEPGMPAVDSILCDFVSLSCDDVRAVGTKLVIKGSASVGAVYRAQETGKASFAHFVTEFSQVIDAGTELSSPQAGIHLMLTAEYIEAAALSSGERGITCELHLVAQAVISDDVSIEYISDCYCSSVPVSAQYGEISSPCAMRPASYRQTLRETVSADGPVSEVLYVSCCAGEAYADGGVIKCPVTARVVYSSPDGELFGAVKKLTAEYDTGAETSMSVGHMTVCCAEPFAAPAQNGIELRLTVDFAACLICSDAPRQVTELTELEQGGEGIAKPSVVVIRAQADDTLWLLAKRYGSTREAITQANELEADEILSGRMLLIPHIK